MFLSLYFRIKRRVVLTSFLVPILFDTSANGVNKIVLIIVFMKLVLRKKFFETDV